MLQRDATQVVGVADTGVKADECFFRDASVAVPYNTVNQAHRKIVQCGPPTDSATRVCRINVYGGCIGYSRVPHGASASDTFTDAEGRCSANPHFGSALPFLSSGASWQAKLSASKPFVAAARPLVCARERAVSAPGSGRICSV